MVKVDGDGQMDPRPDPAPVGRSSLGEADYAKGNRFYDLEHLRGMPTVRVFGNAMLSLVAKLSTGYWNIFDPTNGYTAIDASVARLAMESSSAATSSRPTCSSASARCAPWCATCRCPPATPTRRAACGSAASP